MRGGCVSYGHREMEISYSVSVRSQYLHRIYVGQSDTNVSTQEPGGR